MISKAPPLQLSDAEALVLTTLKVGRHLHRAGFRGLPFKLAFESLHLPAAKLRFEEAVVYGLIDKGLLKVTQAVNLGQLVVSRPFACVLSPAGEKARVHLLNGYVKARAA